jgi:hypothetical protein
LNLAMRIQRELIDFGIAFSCMCVFYLSFSFSRENKEA